MVDPKAPVLSHSKTPKMRVTLSTSSMAMTGKVACWRSARTDSPVHPAAVTKAVADLEVAWDVEGFEAALEVVEAASEEVTADVVVTEVEEVAMVVRLLPISMTVLLQALLPLQHRIPLPTTPHLEEK